MTDTRAGAIVNEHYLNKVLDLSEKMGVAATEDIYDSHGMKLLAKGANVNRKLQEKLIVHKLRKPIESCIAVEGGVDGGKLAECASNACESSPTLAAIVAASGMTLSTIRREMAAIHLGPAMTMMLTMIDRASDTSLRHVVEVATLAMSFAVRAGLAPADQRITLLAGVLHDIGELYIDPALINAKRVLSPEEWAHVIVHPHIGRLLIHDLESCPDGVAQAVSEHHERLNGTGYPRALTTKQISVPGQMLACAELVSGLLHKPNALQRTDLAMKIVSGEHPRAVAGLISAAARERRPDDYEIDCTAINNDEIARLSERMAAAYVLTDQMVRSTTLSPKHHDLMQRTRERMAVVQRAFLSTGLDMHVAASHTAEADNLEVFESEIALREISWRVRDIGRDLAIQLGAAKREVGRSEELLALLCGDNKGALAGAAASAAHPVRATQAVS
jgi:HD-GYP domain-containing protein (c-di-GMP phosphodiesterase class II)